MCEDEQILNVIIAYQEQIIRRYSYNIATLEHWGEDDATIKKSMYRILGSLYSQRSDALTTLEILTVFSKAFKKEVSILDIGYILKLIP